MMLSEDKPFTFDRVARIAMAAALIWAAVEVLGYLSDVLVPFAAALLLAYLLNPSVNAVQRRIKNRGLSVIVTLAGITALTAVLLWLLVPMIAGEFARMGKLVSDFVGDTEVARRAAERLPPDLWQAVKDFLARDEVRKYLESGDLGEAAARIGRKVLPGIWKVVAGTANVIYGVLGLSVVVLYLVFILIDYAKVSGGWRNLLPEKYRGPAADFLHDFEAGMSRYFRGQSIIAASVGVLCAIGFSLVGLPMAIVLGLFVGLLNMVPYLQLVAVIPAFLLCLVHSVETGAGLLATCGFTALVFAVVQVIQDGILVPRIMGRIMGMTPAVLLLSLSIWGKLLGLLGLLIALPMTVLAYTYYRRIVIGEPVER
jgi:predicted PurR-regulated permease PerM